MLRLFGCNSYVNLIKETTKFVCSSGMEHDEHLFFGLLQY